MFQIFWERSEFDYFTIKRETVNWPGAMYNDYDPIYGHFERKLPKKQFTNLLQTPANADEVFLP